MDRLKRLVAELLLDKQMLQDIAKKSGEPDQQRAAADYPGSASVASGSVASGSGGLGSGGLGVRWPRVRWPRAG